MREFPAGCGLINAKPFSGVHVVHLRQNSALPTLIHAMSEFASLLPRVTRAHILVLLAESEISLVIFIFCATVVAQNMTIIWQISGPVLGTIGNELSVVRLAEYTE